jgi:hypothetical protein
VDVVRHNFKGFNTFFDLAGLLVKQCFDRSGILTTQQFVSVFGTPNKVVIQGVNAASASVEVCHLKNSGEGEPDKSPTLSMLGCARALHGTLHHAFDNTVKFINSISQCPRSTGELFLVDSFNVEAGKQSGKPLNLIGVFGDSINFVNTYRVVTCV